MLRRPLSFTLFPYTTLFRSGERAPWSERERGRLGARGREGAWERERESLGSIEREPGIDRERAWERERSEEHTSELQSPYDLVCRLLLEKKKQSRTRNDRLR